MVRDNFYRHCGIPSSKSVIVGVSGGASSMAMLDILISLRDDNGSRGGSGKIDYNFTVLHLDESNVLSDEPSAPANVQAQYVKGLVESRCAKLKVEVRTLPLAQLMAPESIALIRGSRALGDREDVFDICKRAALLNVTMALASQNLVLGECATTVAWRALSELTRGRGHHMADLCGFNACLQVGPSAKRVFLFRPMRSLLAKEIMLFCKAQSIPSSYLHAPSTGTSLRSVNRTLEKFVTTLNNTFKSTVFNILQSVSKMGPQAQAAASAQAFATAPQSKAMSRSGSVSADDVESASGVEKTTAQTGSRGRQFLFNAILDSLERGYDATLGDLPACTACGLKCEDTGATFCYGCRVLMEQLQLDPSNFSSWMKAGENKGE